MRPNVEPVGCDGAGLGRAEGAPDARVGAAVGAGTGSAAMEKPKEQTPISESRTMRAELLLPMSVEAVDVAQICLDGREGQLAGQPMLSLKLGIKLPVADIVDIILQAHQTSNPTSVSGCGDGSDNADCSHVPAPAHNLTSSSDHDIEAATEAAAEVAAGCTTSTVSGGAQQQLRRTVPCRDDRPVEAEGAQRRIMQASQPKVADLQHPRLGIPCSTRRRVE